MKAIACLLGLLCLTGCGQSECGQLPTSFELVVEIDSELQSGRSMVVTLQNQGEGWRRNYELDSAALEDNMTSVAVQIDPDRSTETDIDITLELHEGSNGSGRLLARSQERFDLSPDGCNTFAMDLDAPEDES